MANGRSHDRMTGLLALPFGLLWWPALGPAGAAIAGGSFLIGGLWLSPDLDTLSRCTMRWGPLSLLWWPYRRLLSHRSLFSHSPFLGMGLRLLYLSGAFVLISALLAPWGTPTPVQLAGFSLQLWQQQRPWLLAALVSLEASSWLHLLQDGDPLPRMPRPLRFLLGRRQRSSAQRPAPERASRPRSPQRRSGRRMAR